MTAQLLIRGARIVDGTGLPAYLGDVEVHDGRITRVGRCLGATAARVIDADGLVLTPGFIDIHTHYDAQVHFESSASPSSWHGVTTVLTGNCGFTLAPSKPEDLEWLTLMLAKVEGMSAEALAAGVDFAGGRVRDFLENLDGRVGVNLAMYVGHAALRRWVMGPAASERAATEDEIRAMQALLDEGMRDGAIGFSTSQLEVHADHEGKPVPPNLAAPEELVALSSVLASYEEGVLEHLCRSFALGYDEQDRKLLAAMTIASGGKPLHANILLRFTGRPDVWRECLNVLEGYARDGLRVYPMASANPKGIHIALGDTIMLDEMPTFRATLSTPFPERAQLLRDPDVRERMRREFGDISLRQFVFGWGELRVVGVRDAVHDSWVGRTVADLAAARGDDGLDTFLDCSLEEDLETVFVVDRPVSAEDRDVIGFLLRHPLTMPGSSDGGAHVNTFCGADYTTRILAEYAGRDGFSFEAAVRKLTAVPAATSGLWDRGVIQPGAAADLVLMDRDRLAVGAVRFVRDFPAGAGRLVFDEEGYEATIVNGEVIVEHGQATGATPGTVLRFNRDRGAA
jgi:N-acyl-D-aspartate/D-glutamate deacylase